MKWLEDTRVLAALLLLTGLAAFCFGLFRPGVGGAYLDMLADPEAARALLGTLTPTQRSVHLQVTLVLDTLFPVSFGLLCAGLALRLPGPWRRYASLPAIMAIGLDLAENGVQVLALSGSADLLAAKAWLTPAKFALFGLAATIALVSAIAGLRTRLRRPAG